MKTVEMNIDLNKFRYSLAGNGYTIKEVEALSEEELITIFKRKVIMMIENGYHKSVSLFGDEIPY